MQNQDKGRIRSIFRGAVGNLIEWYDWYVYAAFSIYFAKSFFPNGNLTAQLLNTSAIFAVGFFMRPLGGWLMGSYADRHGRRKALIASVFLMSIGSLIIALTPTYQQIGIFAPLMLTFARLLQGLSVGGEYAASATYLSEMATKANRGFYSSFQYVSLIAGQLLALLVLLVLQQVVLTPEQLSTWGWRIPFFIGAILALIALYLRLGMIETNAFKAEQNKKRPSGIKALMTYPKEVLMVIGLTMGGTLAFYTFSTYMQKYLVNSLGMPSNTSTIVTAASLFVFMCLQPLMGWISDKIGRKPLLMMFGICGSLFTFPILSTLQCVHDPLDAFFLIMIALSIVSGYTAINAIVKAELFPAEIRALGVGLPYALTVSIFGGTAEYIALWFKNIGYEQGFFWYVTACVVVSLLVYVLMPDTEQQSKLN